MVWTRSWLAAAVGLCTVACGDEGSGQDTQGMATTGATDSADPTGPDDGVDPDSGGCVPGQAGCACLEDQCVGGTFCIEGMCVLGPQIELDEDRAVVGGVILPIEAEVMAEEFAWSQVAGPPVEILGAQGLNIAIPVPPDAPPGEVITLRLTAFRNEVTLEADLNIEILDAAFTNVLPKVADPTQLGTTEGLGFGPMGMYVVSTEGFVSRFNADGAFLESFDVGGVPVGANFMGENLLIANREGTGSIQQLNSVSGNIGVLFDSLAGGGPLGQVNFPLPDGNGNVFVSTRLDQTIVRYEGKDEEGGGGTASLFIDNNPALVNPNALARGPEGNMLYVGTVGHVWRIPLVDGGGAGEPQDYLDLGDDTGETYEVDGLIFDEGGNMWVGCPNAGTLYVAHYSAKGPTEISRTFDTAAANLSGFVSLRFGNNDFDERSLYYTNLAEGTVGRLRVGLDAL